ncbi:hypothetical protein [Cellulomonas sp. HZM]|uniref:hypothetical protein n=1 Tax=Cellulomonas sp. HZM TaxID=1454010 RepID=UPI0004938CAF|nr:hypothetical protein [Cellulomonas sp. HZM]
MSSATVTDEQLRALVPVRSTARTVVAVVLVLAALVGASFAPRLLRADVLPSQSTGGWVRTGDGAVVATSEVSGATWPWARIDGVATQPGAEVIGWWIVRGPSPQLPEDPATLDDVLTSVGARDATNHRVAYGEHAVVVVAWRVTDCEQLQVDVTRLELSAPFAGRSEQEATMLMSPASDLEGLQQAGVCD